MSILSEAFRQLDLLEEETFPINPIGIQNAKDFIASDNSGVADALDVIDPEVDSVEDVKDSYIGDVICQCDVCKSLIYKNPDEINISEDGQLVDEMEECPFCFNVGSLKIIGKVQQYSDDDAADDSADIEVDGEKLADQDDAINLGESFNEDTECDEGADSCIDEICTMLDDLGLNESDLDEFLDATGYNAEDVLLDSDINDMFQQWAEDPDSIFDEDGYLIEKLGHKIRKSNCKKLNEAKSAYSKLVDAGYIDGNDLDEGVSRSINESAWDQLEKYLTKHEDSDLDEVEESLNESFEEVNIKTEDQTMLMTQDPKTGRVTVETEPVRHDDYADADDDFEVDADFTSDDEDADNDDEMIAPLDNSDIEELDTLTDSSDNDLDDEDEVDLDIDQVDEESFDELGESYLRNTYSNVKSYKTTNAYSDGDRLKLEGVIEFNSGAKKTTQFLFKPDGYYKNKKLSFIGENMQLTSGKKSFKLNGELNNSTFIAESLRYNYTAKDSNGNSVKVYGTRKA